MPGPFGPGEGVVVGRVLLDPASSSVRDLRSPSACVPPETTRGLLLPWTSPLLSHLLHARSRAGLHRRPRCIRNHRADSAYMQRRRLSLSYVLRHARSHSPSDRRLARELGHATIREDGEARIRCRLCAQVRQGPLAGGVSRSCPQSRRGFAPRRALHSRESGSRRVGAARGRVPVQWLGHLDDGGIDRVSVGRVLLDPAHRGSELPGGSERTRPTSSSSAWRPSISSSARRRSASARPSSACASGAPRRRRLTANVRRRTGPEMPSGSRPLLFSVLRDAPSRRGAPAGEVLPVSIQPYLSRRVQKYPPYINIRSPPPSASRRATAARSSRPRSRRRVSRPPQSSPSFPRGRARRPPPSRPSPRRPRAA